MCFLCFLCDFDLVFAGLKPSVRHHLRAEKMALWLDLIPKLHRSDNSDSSYHQLENSDDPDSFDDSGTRDLVTRLPRPPSASPSPPSFPTYFTTRPSTTYSGTFVAYNAYSATPPVPSWIAGQRPTRRSSNRRTSSYSTVVQPTLGGKILTLSGDPDGPKSPSSASSTGALPLSITLSVGGGMLALNVLLFVSVLCLRKIRLSQTTRRRERYAEKTLRIVGCSTGGATSAGSNERIHVIDLVDRYRKSSDGGDDVSRAICLSASPNSFRQHRSTPISDGGPPGAQTPLARPSPPSGPGRSTPHPAYATYTAVPRFQPSHPTRETDVDLVTPNFTQTTGFPQQHSMDKNRSSGSNNHCTAAGFPSKNSNRDNF